MSVPLLHGYGADDLPKDTDLLDALACLGSPDVVTASDVIEASRSPHLIVWLEDHRTARQRPARFGGCGYVVVRNPHAKDGFWAVNERRQVIYAKRELSLRERTDAARKRTYSV